MAAELRRGCHRAMLVFRGRESFTVFVAEKVAGDGIRQLPRCRERGLCFEIKGKQVPCTTDSRPQGKQNRKRGGGGDDSDCDPAVLNLRLTDSSEWELGGRAAALRGTVPRVLVWGREMGRECGCRDTERRTAPLSNDREGQRPIHRRLSLPAWGGDETKWERAGVIVEVTGSYSTSASSIASIWIQSPVWTLDPRAMPGVSSTSRRKQMGKPRRSWLNIKESARNGMEREEKNEKDAERVDLGNTSSINQTRRYSADGT
ncbi:hypothetical protein K438DRAFT_1768779 [Mycena galopus ATCC 62051]|nr:hypothetical protein K438DRAFT_1768779 [Mycena galopus ATCC 62051]